MIRNFTQRWLIIPLVALMVTAGAALSHNSAANGTALLTALLNALGLMPDGCSGCVR